MIESASTSARDMTETWASHIPPGAERVECAQLSYRFLLQSTPAVLVEYYPTSARVFAVSNLGLAVEPLIDRSTRGAHKVAFLTRPNLRWKIILEERPVKLRRDVVIHKDAEAGLRSGTTHGHHYKSMQQRCTVTGDLMGSAVEHTLGIGII